MRGIHQLAQLRVRVRRVLGEPGLGTDEVMDTISMVIGPEVCQHRAEPQGANPQLLYVGKLCGDPSERPPWKSAKVGSSKGLCRGAARLLLNRSTIKK